MYGATSKSSHYLKRTGSYSTVPHAGGRVDVLPPSASTPIYGDICSRRDALVSRVKTAEKVLSDLKTELNMLRPLFTEYSKEVQCAKDNGKTPPIPPFKIRDYRRRREAAIQEKGKAILDLRTFNGTENPKAVRSKEWGELFALVAEQLLDEETYLRIKSEVEIRFEIAKDVGRAKRA